MNEVHLTYDDIEIRYYWNNYLSKAGKKKVLRRCSCITLVCSFLVTKLNMNEKVWSSLCNNLNNLIMSQCIICKSYLWVLYSSEFIEVNKINFVIQIEYTRVHKYIALPRLEMTEILSISSVRKFSISVFHSVVLN